MIRDQCFSEITQDKKHASYVSRRNLEDEMIDWSLPATTLVNLVRALSCPWPGTFSYFDKDKFIICKAQVFQNYDICFYSGMVLS